jgi:DNA-binding GntR family transcriptional regulator
VVTSPDAESSGPWAGAHEYEPGYVYLQVAERIAARIESGELARHERLPAEQQLADEFGVSLGTARHATRVLRERGLVFTVRAKGTFVADRNRHNGGG